MLSDLLSRFHDALPALKRGAYNETEVRVQFINPLFAALGWDMDDRHGRAEVKHEDKIAIAGKAKAPDYGFYLDGRRRFFVEAKKPAVNLAVDSQPAFQLRRYAWTAKLPLSVLTDFEEFAVYDTRLRPAQKDAPTVARLRYWRYDQYEAHWDEIAALFGRDAVLAGSLEQFAAAEGGKKGIATVDAEFLRQLNEWRDLLARAIANRNPGLSGRDLNFAVQQTLDRLIFLRIAEDRAIEPYGRLRDLATGPGTFDQLLRYFYEADNKYNSGLFHFRHEKPGDAPDMVSPRLTIDDRPLKEIIRALYEPHSPYEFSVFPADILGQVYEQFLGQVIRLTTGGRAVVEEKPEVRKAGGVYYTPTYIVDYIVRQTVGRLLAGHTPDPTGPTSRLRVLDPACGSGSFLLGAYQFLLDWHLAGYRKDTKKWSRKRGGTLHLTAAGDYVLTLAERRRILLDNLYGVDIDPQAVEVTKLSLLLKVLEGAATQLGPQAALLGERVLPDLDGNVKCGNSLIGPDFYERPPTADRRRLPDGGRPSAVGGQLSFLPPADDDLLRVNAFDWRAEFRGIMANGGFDAVIGNPPYVRQESLKEYKGYFEAAYKTFRSTADLYVGFIEKGHEVLKPGGLFGMIVSNKWLRAAYGRPLREYLTQEVSLVELVDFAGLPVFPDATVRTIIVISTRSQPRGEPIRYLPPPSMEQFKLIRDSAQIEELVRNNGLNLSLQSLNADGWSLTGQDKALLIEKLRRAAVTLGEYLPGHRVYRGLITGLNEAFILNEQQRASLIREDPNSAEIIKPVVGGREVRRYGVHSKSKYILWTYIGVPIRKYPAVFNHLKSYQTKLEPRWDKGNHWWELRACDYYDKFEQPKIIYPDIATTCRFTLDTEGYFSTNTTYFIPGDDLYLLGLLNSRVAQFYFTQVCAGLEGGDTVYLRFFGQYMDGFPVRRIDPTNPTDVAQHDHLVALVQQMLDLHQRHAAEGNPQMKTMLQRQIDATDRQIDRVVYGLYGLTAEEVEVVEGMG